jgi:hypothetical protein
MFALRFVIPWALIVGDYVRSGVIKQSIGGRKSWRILKTFSLVPVSVVRTGFFIVTGARLKAFFPRMQPCCVCSVLNMIVG